MKFASIQDLLERTRIDSRAADCLGLSGALGGIANLNESEAAEYARDFVKYLRERDTFLLTLEKRREKDRQSEEEYGRKVSEWQKKVDEKFAQHKQKVADWEREKSQREETNRVNREKGKKEVKIPPAPKPPAIPREIQKPAPKPLPQEPQLPTPQRKVLSEKDRISLQRDMLHCYLKGHPLDSIKLPDEVITISSIKQEESNSCHTICGVLQSFKETQSRAGTIMARLRVEDRSGGIEVILFPSLYGRVRGTLTKGEVYTIQGRVKLIQGLSDDDPPLTQITGQSIEKIIARESTQWEIRYPLLKGSIRVLPRYKTSTKSNAVSIIMRTAREDMKQSGPLQSH